MFRTTCTFLLILLLASLHPASTQNASPSQNTPWNDLLASMHKMHADASQITPSSSTDLDFVRLMLPHHQAAMDMARTELLYGKDPQIRRLAQEILTDQQSEMELMQLWIKQHDPTDTPSSKTKIQKSEH